MALVTVDEDHSQQRKVWRHTGIKHAFGVIQGAGEDRLSQLCLSMLVKPTRLVGSGRTYQCVVHKKQVMAVLLQALPAWCI